MGRGRGAPKDLLSAGSSHCPVSGRGELWRSGEQQLDFPCIEHPMRNQFGAVIHP